MHYIETLQRQVETMLEGFVQQVPSLTIALIVLVITWIVAKFAVRIGDRLTRGTHMRENLKQLVETLVRLAIWLLGIMIAATIAMPGLTPASVFAGLGIGALAIGFAFQDIFENFLAGVLIMVRDRMRIGDSIECESITGTIERITLRETHIRGPSNELTIVPNSVLFKNPVKISTDKPDRRFELLVSVAGGADIDQAEATIRRAIESVKGIDEAHPIEVFAQEFKLGQIDIVVHWWSSLRSRDAILKDEIIRGIKRALDDAGIERAASTTQLVIDPESMRALGR